MAVYPELYEDARPAKHKIMERCRHVLFMFVLLFSPPCRWPHNWPKHVVDPYAIILDPQNRSAYVGP